MKTQLLTLFTRAPLHVGAGASVGAVDQPVVRERHARFPVIPGSSLKGVLADLWLEKNEKGEIVRSREGKDLFGFDEKQTKENPGYAGALYIGESKLLAFPVRSAKGCFAWITCPLALARFNRDTREKFNIPSIGVEKASAKVSSETDVLLTFKDATGKDATAVVFEEYSMPVVKDEGVNKLAEAIKPLCSDRVWSELVSRKLVVVDDETFAYFAKNACEVAQHNRISDKTNTVDGTGFFNQENVPSETLFYTLISSEDEKLLVDKFVTKVKKTEMLQIGADMTTGLGWCSVTFTTIV